MFRQLELQHVRGPAAAKIRLNASGVLKSIFASDLIRSRPVLAEKGVKKAMSKRLLRLFQVYGKQGRLPVGRTKFYEDFVHTGRLRLVHLGPKAVAVLEDELDQLIAELSGARDKGSALRGSDE